MVLHYQKASKSPKFTHKQSKATQARPETADNSTQIFQKGTKKYYDAIPARVYTGLQRQNRSGSADPSEYEIPQEHRRTDSSEFDARMTVEKPKMKNSSFSPEHKKISNNGGPSPNNKQSSSGKADTLKRYKL